MSTLQKIVLVLLAAIAYRSGRQYLAGCVCSLEGRLDNRVALVLAADTDIGIATVRGLARRGARVVMACQVVDFCNTMRQQLVSEFAHSKAGSSSPERIAESKMREDTIKSVSSIKADQLYVRRLHISSAAEIKKFCEAFIAEFKQLNILIVNAVYLSTKPERTVEGFERNMGLNYLASFLITQHLLPLLERSANPDAVSRLVFVSSRLHNYGELPTALTTARIDPKTYSWWKAYSSSHLALLTYANYLNTHVNPSKIRIVSVHPGFENRHFSSVLPEPFAYLMTWVGKSPWQAAQTTIFVTLMRAGEPGVYFEDCESVPPHPNSFNTDAAEQMIKMTRRKLKVYLPQGIPKSTKRA
ncbi:unnamed protein product [Hydatigera taeniaeformis]|uniref:Retinol dehydrogenase 14 n=1 Tax=Hydatigena taeniaeformis TaxID=6205 RepID=A0A158REW9_HYDTA|nr:unnamed protein product [Hydatigera taeniaeformis]